jgi:bacillolysin
VVVSTRRIFWLVALSIVVWFTGEGRPAGQTMRSGQTIAPASSAALQNWAGIVDSMQRDGRLRVENSEADALVIGRRHDRLTQYYQGVPIFGATVNRQVEGTQVVSLFGTIYADVSLPTTTPRLTVAQAQQAVAKIAGADLRAVKTPELVILPKEDGGYALTYKAQVVSYTGPIVYFVDAATGEKVWEYNNRQSQSVVRTGKGVLGDMKKVSMRLQDPSAIADDLLRPPVLRTYDMKGNLTRTKQFLSGVIALQPSDLATTASDPWTDGAAVDAHVYVGWTYDYYYKRFGRRGLDNKNTPILNLVHPANRNTVLTASPADYDYYINAFWDDGVMVYGDGLPPNVTIDGVNVTYFAGSIDIVSHELTHGVTQYTSALIYFNESGALNEAFSDIMGTSVEFFYQPVRGHANYVMGDDLTSPNAPDFNRSLANPKAFGDPDHYSLRYTGTSDNGGVHTNSCIVSHAFYLAVEGGTNRTSGLSVAGVGSGNREQMEKVFYRAFTQLMPSNSTFSVARAATIQAARDLYGNNSAAERAVTQAWTAVGVN